MCRALPDDDRQDTWRINHETHVKHTLIGIFVIGLIHRDINPFMGERINNRPNMMILYEYTTICIF